MKGKLIALLTTGFVLIAGMVQAQLMVGPTLKGGATYGANTVVDDTSRFYLMNSPSAYLAGGLDVLYKFDDNIRVQVGIQYSQKNFTLAPPNPVDGLSFDEIPRKTTVISVPMTIHYRIPLTEHKMYLNFIGGHSIDFTQEDTILNRTPLAPIDSGGSYIRQHLVNVKRIIPTVILGAGVDFQMSNGSVLNASLLWGLGTGEIVKGELAEWEVLNGPYNPIEQEYPEEFPEHYYEFSLRGSYMGLKVSYWFNLEKLFNKDKEEDGGDESLIEDEES